MKTAVQYQTIDDLPKHLIEPILRFWLAFADTKHRIGLQCSHWVTGTPALEGAVGSAALTQDELGHARTLYGILRYFPNAPAGMGAENDLEARDVYYAPSALTPHWSQWVDVIAINLTLDRALQMVMETAVDASYTPISGCASKLIHEEQFHRIFGDNWLEKLATIENPKLHVQLQESINHASRITQLWLGPADDPTLNLLIENDMFNNSVKTISEQWAESLANLLAKFGFDLPKPITNWSGWDPNFRERQ